MLSPELEEPYMDDPLPFWLNVWFSLKVKDGFYAVFLKVVYKTSWILFC